MKKITLTEETYNLILNLSTVPQITSDPAVVTDDETGESLDLIKLLNNLRESLIKETQGI
jgi:hypothetical protein